MASKKEKRRNSKKIEKQRLEKLKNGSSSDGAGVDEVTTGTTANSGGSSSAGSTKRNKDSRGKKIPTESERRAKNQLKDTRVSSVSGQLSSKQAKKKDKQAEKINIDDLNFIETLILYCRQHLVTTGIVLVLIVVLIVASYAIITALSSDDGDSVYSTTDKTKVTSLVGTTMQSKYLMDDLGIFDNFLVDDESGETYTNLFDCVITDDEYSVLVDRGQEPVGDGTYTYNVDRSSLAQQEADSADEAADTDTTATDSTEDTSTADTSTTVTD